MKTTHTLKVIVHDLNEHDFSLLRISNDDFEVINANGSFVPCMGCFHCWFKTPGSCKTNGGQKNYSALMGNSEEIIIISQNCYGGYSEQVKKVIDHNVANSLPFFTYRSWKMRHIGRYKIEKKRLVVFLYGDFTEAEKNTAQLIVETNRSNMGFREASLHILKDFNEIGKL
jgi:multimeric flavodoxin WrbA